MNNFEEFQSPQVISVSTIRRDTGQDSYFLPKIQLQPTVDIVNGILLRSACIQSSCIVPQFYSVLDTVCNVSDTTSLCDHVDPTVDKSEILGFYFRIANLGARTQSSAQYSLNLTQPQRLVGLFLVNFGDVILQDERRTVVKLVSKNSGESMGKKLNYTGTHL